MKKRENGKKRGVEKAETSSGATIAVSSQTDRPLSRAGSISSGSSGRVAISVAGCPVGELSKQSKPTEGRDVVAAKPRPKTRERANIYFRAEHSRTNQQPNRANIKQTSILLSRPLPLVVW